jgi:hypothetical protein
MINQEYRILPLVLFLFGVLLSMETMQGQMPGRGNAVAIIAPSVSTSIEARRIIARQGWHEGKLKTADAILVVVRSELSLPLQSSYSFIGELKEDADRQLNIAGSNFHFYIYQLGDDLECTELNHVSYKAD